MPPVGPVVVGLLVTVIALVAPPAVVFVIGCGGVNAIGCEFVMFGFTTAGAVGGSTFTFTNGGFEFAQVSACCFVSKNLSITRALRSLVSRPKRRAAFRFRTALPVSTAERLEPSGKTTRLP